jgi:uncharacterized membrane protein YeaQ/YmgE (transglycosylase-associated protein family)
MCDCARTPRRQTWRARPDRTLTRRRFTKSLAQENSTMTLTPAVTFLIVLVIGVVAGLLVDRFAGPSWFKRQIAGAMPSMITSALVGVAGAFGGFHLAEAFKLTAQIALVGAVLGAAAVLLGWRTVR